MANVAGGSGRPLRARLALVVSVVSVLVLVGVPAGVHAQSELPGAEPPTASTLAPGQGLPTNESGTVPGGGSSGGGAASPSGSSSGGAPMVTLILIAIAVAFGIGAFVVTRQRRLEREGVT